MCSRPSRSENSTVTALIRLSSVRYLMRCSWILWAATRSVRCFLASRFSSSSSPYGSMRKSRRSVGIGSGYHGRTRGLFRHLHDREQAACHEGPSGGSVPSGGQEGADERSGVRGPRGFARKGLSLASPTDAFPAAAADDRRLELTVRGLILGALITLVFTAANGFRGLKVGLTFASSIPAAVISMAVLRAFRNSTIWENNIVQTVASAAGTLSSVIFVLPGLVMVGWWTGFPFWQSFGICLVGGILGVMYSVPLRRAMVTGSDLPYPEGVAAAEVLQVGAGAMATGADADPAAAAEHKAGLITVVWSSVVSALFAAVL